jgi:RND family efflux transporter MFP subunit
MTSPKQSDANGNQTRTFKQYALMVIWNTLPWAAAVGAFALAATVLYVRIEDKKERIAKEREAATGNGEVPTVDVATWVIEPQRFVDEIELPGVVQPWEDLTVEAQVGGRIVELLAEKGEDVEAGAVLARIDARDYEAAVKTAEAGLASARASLVGAEAKLSLARQSMERTRSLHEQGAVPQSKLDAAQADLDAAISSRDLAKAGIEQARASLEKARLSLERCEITAPFAGEVNARHITRGTLVKAGTPIYELLDLRKVRVQIGIPEADYDAVRNLRTAELEVDSLGGRTYAGEKVFLSGKPEQVAQVYLLELAVENADGSLQPGMFADANIVRAAYEDAIVVPLYAVIARDEEQFAIVVTEDGTAARRDVRVGLKKGRRARILEGLEPGVELIVQGHRQVEPGQKVNVVRTLDDPSEVTP